MPAPNKHDWKESFINDTCRICFRDIPTGTGKAEHAKKHWREGRLSKIGEGTKENPYQYVMKTSPGMVCPECRGKTYLKNSNQNFQCPYCGGLGEIPAGKDRPKTTMKPCPFCGGTAEIRSYEGISWKIQCSACGASRAAFHNPIETAIALWNQRS